MTSFITDDGGNEIVNHKANPPYVQKKTSYAKSELVFNIEMDPALFYTI